MVGKKDVLNRLLGDSPDYLTRDIFHYCAVFNM